MSEPARNRFALDLEDLERQLRSAGQAPKAGPAADPLAELPRIVDQGDPLKGIFGQRGQVPAAPRSPASWQAPAPVQSRREPDPEPVRPVRVVGEQPAPPAEMRGALDEFEALLRRTDSVARQAPAPAPAAVVPARAEPRFAPEAESFELPEPQPYQRPAGTQGQVPAPRDLDEEREPYPYYEQQHYEQEPQAHAELPADDAMPVLETRRSRRGLYAAAAVIAVGVIGVGVAMSLRGLTTPSDGQPPTITADTGPTKVEPANPGGAEIPNQNKQIYERAGDTAAGGTKVVSREEQPVDVQQAARSLQPRAAVPAVGSGVAATPAANALAQAPAALERSPVASEPMLTPVPPVPGLGEPRRVRTVTIRPDGTPAPPPNSDASYTNGTLPNTTGSAPAVRPGAIDPSMAQPRPRPAAAPELPKVQERAAAPAPATTPSTPLRIANAPAAAQAPAAPAAPATAAIRSGTGEFVVQLGAPGSESEARATFAALQRKYPGQLTGQAPIIRKTELAGGKTVYRLRVGPYSREDATTMCTQLQAAGGQCFIAKN